MQLDQKKYDRQRLCFSRWIDGGCNGVLEAVTGFGKTMVAIMAIQDMNSRHHDRNTIVIVPHTKLKEDWTGYFEEEKGVKTWIPGHIEIHALKNVRVFVVNTYIKYKDWVTDLLILDEVHHYASYDSLFFSTVLDITKRRFLMGLSATLSIREKDFLKDKGNMTVFDVIGDMEAERDGYISQSITYNLAVKLTSIDQKFNDDINQSFRYYFAKFDHQFELVKACNMPFGVQSYVRLTNGTSLGRKTSQEWRKYLATKNGWNGDPVHPWSPDNISKYAAQAMMIMKKRKDHWQNLPSKIDIVDKIVKKFGLKTLIFSQSAAFADKITAKIGNSCMSYHTKLQTVAIKDGCLNVYPKNGIESKALRKDGYTVLGKTVLLRQALTEFSKVDGHVKNLSTVMALDEGFDDSTVECILMVAYHSTKRQNTQREGRGKRTDYNNLEKKTLIINLYVKGTQEEKWLKTKQKEKKGIVRWVESIEDIVVNQVITLSKPTVNIDAKEVVTNQTI